MLWRWVLYYLELVRSPLNIIHLYNVGQVHCKHAPLQIAAARLLRSFAAADGVLRANVVAAGALPAVDSVSSVSSQKP